MFFENVLKTVCCLTLLIAAGPAIGDEGRDATTVGMAGRIEQLVLPGSELEAKPLTEESLIVLRIVETYPHGTDFRYDLEFYGLAPGEFNLVDYLQRKDRSPAEGLPEVKVTINSILSEDQVEPHTLSPTRLDAIGGYQTLIILGAVLWLSGLAAILLIRRKTDSLGGGELESQQRSLADRLQEQVDAAINGRLSHDELAELEMMLVSFWRKKLDLEQMDAGRAIIALRNDNQAGPLLRQLELWLHRPAGSAADTDSPDVALLLAPYKNLPADALEPVEPETITK